jgi:hypothetical protein
MPKVMSEGIDKGEGRKGAAKLLGGRISCIVGILFGAGGTLFALLGASVNVSAGAVGAALGVLGFFLGARRLGAATIVLGVIAVFVMAAASTGLIPGVTPVGHGYN